MSTNALLTPASTGELALTLSMATCAPVLPNILVPTAEMITVRAVIVHILYCCKIVINA